VKTENLRTVKNNLSSVIEELPDTGPVLITKSGKARAMLIPITNETDLESLMLSNSSRFWQLYDRAAQTRRWTRLEKLR
jgi:prevent-host-death family protein